MPAPDDLVSRWRDEASILRCRGAPTQADVLEGCARELEQVLAEDWETPLTLRAAAAVSGYSPDHLGRLVKDGKLRNYGRPSAPKVRPGDLPRKPGLPKVATRPQLMGASARQIARAVTTSAMED